MYVVTGAALGLCRFCDCDSDEMGGIVSVNGGLRNGSRVCIRISAEHFLFRNSIVLRPECKTLCILRGRHEHGTNTAIY